MYINHRHYILFVLAFLTAVLSAFGYAMLRQTVMSQSILTQDALHEIAAVDERKQHEEATASIYEKTGENRERISNLVVTPDHVIDFIKSVEKIGDDVGVDLELSAISNDPPAKDGTSYLKGRIDAHGSWAHIMQALTLVEHMPYALSLSSVRLSQSSSSISPPIATEMPKAGVKKEVTAPVWDLSIDVKVLTTH